MQKLANSFDFFCVTQTHLSPQNATWITKIMVPRCSFLLFEAFQNNPFTVLVLNMKFDERELPKMVLQMISIVNQSQLSP